MCLVWSGVTVQLDATTRQIISSDVDHGAVKFRVIGQDTGDYRGMSVNRTIGSTISFRWLSQFCWEHTCSARQSCHCPKLLCLVPLNVPAHRVVHLALCMQKRQAMAMCNS